MLLLKPNPSSGVPIYLQLIERVKHAIATGALRTGEQLPGIRPLAEELVINPNTVAKAYRELEHEGVIELRQGKNREVRRLCAAIGHEVTRLRRVSFAGIELGALAPGQWRVVGEDELRAWSTPARGARRPSRARPG